MRKLFFSLAAVTAITLPSSGQLFLDFDNDGTGSGQDNTGAPHTEAGYQSYSASHEVPGSFGTRVYTVDWAQSGPGLVSVTPAWPNTTDNRVQQMIDRTATFDVNWVGDKLNLLTDWLGTDTRTANGGLGDYNGLVGDPTWLTITLGGLPAGDYSWLSYHHDTEHINSFFTIELSADAGGSFVEMINSRMTDSTPGGTPDSLNPISGALDPDPANLPSTASFSFSASGSDEVVLRFTPLSQTAVHQQFFGINGFELVQVPEPSTVTFVLLGAAGLLLLRRRK